MGNFILNGFLVSLFSNVLLLIRKGPATNSDDNECISSQLDSDALNLGGTALVRKSLERKALQNGF